MSAQPTLTRLFAMIAFAAFAVYAAISFQLLQDGARVSGMFNTVAAIIAAVSGWLVAGPRIDGRLVASFFAVVQGMVVAILLCLAASATVETFRLGYATRYKDVGQAVQGFFDHIATRAQALLLPDILIPMAVFCLVASVALSVLFRLLEARRNAR